MLVVFALLLPLFLGIGALGISVGNWFVHARHLQTQVDAAAFAAGTTFSACFAGSDAANDAIREAALRYAGDVNRDSGAFNPQFQEPADIHVVLNSENYWERGDPPDDTTLRATLDNSITYPGDLEPPPTDPSDPCETRFLDVKGTDATVPDIWPSFVGRPDVKRKARIEIRKAKAISGLLPFAVPEILPGAVAAIFVDEDAAAENEVVSAVELSRTPPPPESPLRKFNIFDGLVGGIEISSRDNLSVIILVSKTTIPDPFLGGTSLAAICGQSGVACYSGSGKQDGLALVHGYSTGAEPAVRRVDVSGCNDAVNLSGPYFSRTGDCVVVVSASIDFGSVSSPQVRLYNSRGCSGGFTPMTQSGALWTAATTLPEPSTSNEPSASTGQVPFTIGWRAGGGSFTCFPGGTVARPYVFNGWAGPIEYLSLQAYDKDGELLANAYSIPKEPTMQPFTFMVTVGLKPPLKQSSLNDEAIVLRFASGGPSQTQSIDCDIDSYTYPPPFDSMPKDAAEIGYGCVTPYAVNDTLDCSDYSLGDLPPNPIPDLDGATDCARSKQGQVTSLRMGLRARLESPCTPNRWPDPPITDEKLNALVENFDNDPRLVTLMVTEFSAFSGTGSTIVPVKYFAGFYITGWDEASCTDNDPHPIFGTTYKPQLDDGDVWGYFVTPVKPGRASNELCTFDELGACVAALVE